MHPCLPGCKITAGPVSSTDQNRHHCSFVSEDTLRRIIEWRTNGRLQMFAASADLPKWRRSFEMEHLCLAAGHCSYLLVERGAQARGSWRSDHQCECSFTVSGCPQVVSMSRAKHEPSQCLPQSSLARRLAFLNVDSSRFRCSGMSFERIISPPASPPWISSQLEQELGAENLRFQY